PKSRSTRSWRRSGTWSRSCTRSGRSCASRDDDVLTIDGSQGGGGGQILRPARAFSLVTAPPFTIEKIRAGRRKPGLLRQHLTAVNAAVAVGGSEVDGATLGSQTLVFRPRVVKPGGHRFAIGTAGRTGRGG